MALTKEGILLREYAKKRLDEMAVDEPTALFQLKLTQLTIPTKRYEVLREDLERMIASNNDRTILPVRKLEDPDKMSIWVDDNHPHHMNTDKSRLNSNRRDQETSLRKRIDEYNKKRNQSSKFSSIKD